MMSENNILDKAFQFAIRIVKLQQYLVNTHKEHVLSKQLLRSGISIGANINEAQAAQSNADFIAKMAIASKESRETYYWLRLLCATDYLNSQDEHTKALLVQIEELIKILTNIVKNQKK